MKKEEWAYRCVECNKECSMIFEEWLDAKPLCDECKEKYPDRVYGVIP